MVMISGVYMSFYNSDDDVVILRDFSEVSDTVNMSPSELDSSILSLKNRVDEVPPNEDLFNLPAEAQTEEPELVIVTKDEVDAMGGYFDPSALSPEEETVQILDVDSIGEDNLYGIPLENPLEPIEIENRGLVDEKRPSALSEP